MDSYSDARGFFSYKRGTLLPFGLQERSESSDEEDRLSSLPEYILSDILSYVSTPEAIRTSVLGRRWRYIWKSVRNIAFDLNKIQHSFKVPPSVAFSCIMSKKRRREREAELKTIWEEEDELKKLKHDQVIYYAKKVLSYIQSVDLLKFSLLYTAHHQGNSKLWRRAINAWITIAATRGAQEFDLSLHLGEGIHQLPESFFTNDSLEVIKLSLHENVLKLPCTMGFTRLKTMHLVSVKFNDEKLTSQLFSSSPVLENLVLDECLHQVKFKVLDISSPSLKRLVIKVSKRHILYEVWSSCLFKIFTPRLEVFSYKGFAPREFTVGELPFVRTARICCLPTSSGFGDDANVWPNVIDELHSVQVLKIRGICITNLLSPACLYIPFRRLSHLELSLENFGKRLQAILCLMTTSTGLETLVIKFPPHNVFKCHKCQGRKTVPVSDNKYMGVLEKFSEKKLENLRKFEMKNIEGDLDLYFLKLVIETQVFLETVTIRCSDRGHISKIKLRETLLNFRSASPYLSVVLL